MLFSVICCWAVRYLLAIEFNASLDSLTCFSMFANKERAAASDSFNCAIMSELFEFCILRVRTSCSRDSLLFIAAKYFWSALDFSAIERATFSSKALKSATFCDAKPEYFLQAVCMEFNSVLSIEYWRSKFWYLVRSSSFGICSTSEEPAFEGSTSVRSRSISDSKEEIRALAASANSRTLIVPVFSCSCAAFLICWSAKSSSRAFRIRAKSVSARTSCASFSATTLRISSST